MPQNQPPRTKPMRTYASVFMFLAVYLGVLVLVFAPKDMIATQTGAVFAENE